MLMKLLFSGKVFLKQSSKIHTSFNIFLKTNLGVAYEENLFHIFPNSRQTTLKIFKSKLICSRRFNYSIS
ncbi:hypothetical protein D9V84_06375 [Bacteroidetes/Chlorobi group bacterium Naka2016]|nr:MAG: hypothetical protein D9V84_06375 [Bacteroidetes/Chlorobi group bacterium Naka2016]